MENGGLAYVRLSILFVYHFLLFSASLEQCANGFLPFLLVNVRSGSPKSTNSTRVESDGALIRTETIVHHLGLYYK